MAFTNYSMNSDGTSDEIDFGNVLGSFISAGDAGCEYSISFWLKTTTTICNIYSQSTSANYRLAVFQARPVLYMGGGAIFQRWNKLDGTTVGLPDVFDGDWHHWFIYVPSGATPAGIDLANITLNIDGDPTPITLYASPSGTVDVTNGQWDEFSIRNNTWGTFNGNICEIAMWAESDQTANLATIYGGGTPPDLTSLSPTNWWRTGQNAEFGGTNWTVPDATGSFDGTSVNMGVDSRQGFAPNSINNGITVNIGSGDIVAP